MQNEKTLGTYLKELRLKNGLTLDDVSESTGITKDQLLSLESKEPNEISVNTIQSLADLHNVDKRDLFALLIKSNQKKDKGGIPYKMGYMESTELSVPFNAVTFEDLERFQEDQDAIKLARQMSRLTENIISNPDVEDTRSALARLADDFKSRLFKAKAFLGLNKEQESHEEDQHHEKQGPMKTEDGIAFPASDFAFVPDPTKPSTWKLRLTEGRPGNITRKQLGRAVAAFSPGGFRGNRVQLPDDEISSVKARIRREYKKLNIPESEIPASIKEVSSPIVQDEQSKQTDQTTEKKTENKSTIEFFKKENGTMTWIATYSNKFRDNDTPPEIISSESHKRFDQLLKSEQVEYPKLWLYHIPGTEWGTATTHAYDDNGFVVAGGIVYPGYEWIAEHLKTVKNLGVSHGMPIDYIKRSDKDSSIIIEHITKEISPLPLRSAANKLTDFYILTKSKRGENMFDEKDKLKLSELGLDDQAIKKLEELNSNKASNAIVAGIEYKGKFDELQENVSAQVKTLTDQVESLKESQIRSNEQVQGMIAELTKQLTTVIVEVSKNIELVKEAQEKEVKKITLGDDGFDPVKAIQEHMKSSFDGARPVDAEDDAIVKTATVQRKSNTGTASRIGLPSDWLNGGV